MEIDTKDWTETQYWEAIEHLGDVIHAGTGCVARRLHRNDEATMQTLAREAAEMRETQHRLAQELFKKFGIIPPKDHPPRNSKGKYPRAPRGKRWYWVWYEAQKKAFLKTEYAKHICSACPLSTHDLNRFSSGIPCSVFPGSIFRLIPPSHCGMLNGVWSRDELREKIIRKRGVTAWEKFEAKEAELHAAEATAEAVADVALEP